MANYEVDPAILADHVPSGVELDFHDGRCFVSLVAFVFADTRVRGVAIPRHTEFVEVNLRYYVRRGEKRGVVFIKELVPKHAIAWVANLFYGEPYEVWDCRVEGTDYRWGRGSLSNRFSVRPAAVGALPAPDSHDEYITEHYWGYTGRGANRTAEYQVTHPQWEHFAVEESHIEVDFEKVYGKKWSFLTDAQPFSVLFAKGSPIEVFPGTRL